MGWAMGGLGCDIKGDEGMGCGKRRMGEGFGNVRGEEGRGGKGMS